MFSWKCAGGISVTQGNSLVVEVWPLNQRAEEGAKLSKKKKLVL